MAKRDVDFDPTEGIGFMNVDDIDYGAMTLGEKMRHLEVEGYVVLPDALDAAHMERINQEMADAPMGTKDYSDCQTFHREPQWYSPAVAELLANPPVVELLEAHKLSSLPVVSFEGRLRGTILHDALVEAAQQEASE